VAALLGAAGAAQADVSVYGLYDASYGTKMYKDGDAWGDPGRYEKQAGIQTGGNSGNRLGINANADLGGGYKAKAQIEIGQGMDMDGATDGGDLNTLFVRQSWAGVEGSFGEIRGGSQQDGVAYDLFIGLNYNGWSNSTDVTNGDIGYYNGFAGLKYISPVIAGGLTIEAQAALTQDGDRTAQAEADGDPEMQNSYAIGAKYVIGGLTLAVATKTSDVKDGGSYLGFGAQYDFGVLKIKLENHTLGEAKDADTGDLTDTSFGLAVPVGSSTFGVQFTNSDLGKVGGKDVKATGYEVFANTEVGKGFFLYAEYGTKKTDEKGADAASGYNVGFIYAF
jgi:predicted porin